jgi:murein DD-endopeptidase MepM/ murein hydrolase activator NlpD
MAQYNPGAAFTQTSGFGIRVNPTNPSSLQNHGGVDFSAPVGTPIVAASDGRVVYSAPATGYGNTVIIRSIGADGTPYFTLYAHMLPTGLAQYSSDPSAGYVNAGDTIGYVGNTGSSTGPHLHFEILRGDSGVNQSGSGKLNIWSSDLSKRYDPENFDNWPEGGPYGGATAVNSDFYHYLYNPDTFYKDNRDSIYEVGKFNKSPR